MKDDIAIYTPHSASSGCMNPNYQYKIGASIIDLGYINFNQGAEAAKFNGEMTADELNDLSEGEGSESLVEDQKTRYNAILPTALSLQFDYNVNDFIYVNATVIQKLNYPGFYGSERDNLLSLSARYESKWFGVGIPFTLQRYRRPQLGLALRLGPLTIGTDHITPLFIASDLYAVDAYASLRFNIMKSPECREKKRRKSKNKKGKLIDCPAWK